MFKGRFTFAANVQNVQYFDVIAVRKELHQNSKSNTKGNTVCVVRDPKMTVVSSFVNLGVS